MKTRGVLLLGVCFALAVEVCGMDPHLRRVGVPFRFEMDRIEWQAPLGHLPETLPVYRIVDREFPAEVISNLMEITSFTTKERTVNDKQVMIFRNKERTRYLSVMRKLGAIHYDDRAAVSPPGQPVRGVPSEEEVLERGLEIVELLGVNPSELARKADSDGMEVSRGTGRGGSIAPSGERSPTEVFQRSAIFRRRYGEIPSLGGGGGWIRIEFGNHGELSRLQMSWRPIALAGEYPVATKDQFLRWIDQGQCVFVGNVAEGERLTIRGVKAYYLERPYDDEEAEDWIRPVACLGGTVESRGSQVPIRITCPLVVEADDEGRPTTQRPGNVKPQ